MSEENQTVLNRLQSIFRPILSLIGLSALLLALAVTKPASSQTSVPEMQSRCIHTHVSQHQGVK